MLRTFLAKLNRKSSSQEIEGEKSKDSQKGVALLIAISTLAVMMGFMTDLILSTSVSIEGASSIQNRIKAEYASKSGFNLGLYLFSLTWGVELAKPQITGEKGKLVDSSESYWNFINSMPALGADTVKMQDEFSDVMSEDSLGLSGVMNEENRRVMSLFEDSFKIKIEDENGKININDCSKGRCSNILENLVSLFSCPAEKAFLSDKNISPEELAYRIKDFISQSSSTSPESGVGDKDAYYQTQVPAYRTKGLPFDTLDELKLIQGWDDEVHAVFAPYLTVYPINNTNNKEFSKININTASQDLLGCLVPSALSDTCRDSFLKKMKELKSEKKAIAGDDISSTLKDLMCYAPDDNEEKKSKDPGEWFANYSTAFKLSIAGRKGNKKATLNVIVRRLNPGEKIPGGDKPKIQRSYQILHWYFS